MRQTKLKVKSFVVFPGSVFLFILIFLCGFCGCSAVSPQTRTQPQRLPYKETLSAPYDQTKLKTSITLDVLPKMQGLEDEQLIYSDRVVTSLGQSKDGYKTWFNMVTFHEYRLNVIRKYFFVVDDRSRGFWTRLSRGLRFDCEMVLEKEILEEPYASEDARQIAILRYVLGNLHRDIDELGKDNRMLDVCGMLINQTFEMIFLKLDTSPVQVMRLSDAGGVEFDHINFGKGKTQMTVEDDIVTLKIRLGTPI